MKLKTITSLISAFLLLFILGSCHQQLDEQLLNKDTKSQKRITIFNFDNKQDVALYKELQLDSTHPNLLNPQISKDDYLSVRASWAGLHQSIGTYLSEKDFSWEVEDSVITIVQKFYFHPDGGIKSYFFNIRNESVTSQKKKEFGDLITNFSKDHTIDLSRDHNFAQCGKTKYFNK